MNRPMVWVGVSFAVGTFAASQGFCPGFLLPILLQVVGFSAPQLLRRRLDLRTVSVVLCFFGLGAFLWNLREGGAPGDPVSRYAINHPGTVLGLEGRIRKPSILVGQSQNALFELRVDRVTAHGVALPLAGTVLVRWRGAVAPVFADQRVRISGVVGQDIGHVNPDINSAEDYHRRQGVHGVVRIHGKNALTHVGPARWTSVAYWASRLRDYQAQELYHCVPPTIRAFVFAVWLGDRSTMGEDEYESYIESGTAHILAISGLHMAIVFATFAYLIRLWVRPRRTRAILGLGVVFLFTIMSGARLATVRSAVMIAAYLMYDFLDREPDVATALGISGWLLLLSDPTSMYDTGFEISFLSVASILLYSEKFGAALGRLPRPIGSMLGVSLSAQALPFPLAIRVFHLMPLLAPVGNLIIVPLLGGVLWLTFATTFLGLFSRGIGTIFGNALEPLVELIRFTAQSASGHVMLPSPTWVAMALFWGTAVWLGSTAIPRGGWPTRLGVAMLLFTLTVICWLPITVSPRVVLLDVGHGDAAFIETPGGSTALIDGGNRVDRFDFGKRVVAPFLWANHLTRLDYVVMTHPDRDHVGGLRYVLSHFRVGVVVAGPVASEEPLERELIALCAARGIPVWRVHRGESIPVAGAALDVLHPPEDWPTGGSDNNSSVALRLAWPGLTALFTGDAEKAAEDAMAGQQCRAEVLKVGHHGSRTSSSPAFIQRVGPRHAVISTGGGGRFVTDAEVVQRFEWMGARVWRTDFDGGVTVKVRDGGLVVEGERERRGYVTSPETLGEEGQSSW